MKSIVVKRKTDFSYLRGDAWDSGEMFCHECPNVLLLLLLFEISSSAKFVSECIVAIDAFGCEMFIRRI